MQEAIRGAAPYLVPVLAVAWALLRAGRAAGVLKGEAVRTALLVAAVPLALAPLGGISIAALMRGISPGFSVPTVWLFALLVVEELRCSPVMRTRDWEVFFGFNLALGAYLFASVLGLVHYGAYPLGYGFSWIYVVAAAATVALILMRNPMAWAYVAAIGAWVLGLLAHSENFFDYLIDGPLFLISLVGGMVLAARGLKRLARRGTTPG